MNDITKNGKIFLFYGFIDENETINMFLEANNCRLILSLCDLATIQLGV